MTINGKNIAQLGARLLASYKVGGTPVDAGYNKARRGTAVTLLGTELGLRAITLPLDIRGRDGRDCALKKSQLDALLAAGKVELHLPDGFYYASLLQSIGEAAQVMPGLISCTYTLLGVQHDPLVRAQCTGTLFARGTMPRMDCILTATVGTAAAKYNLAGVTFAGVAAGEVLVLDGITKRVLVGGAPAAQRCDIVEWPYLMPGPNRFPCPDPVTVEYYPTYL